jgi:hypothetical protein
VPTDERSAKSTERCSLHPGSGAVALCDGCGRPLCLVCAVPVRGRVLGAECLGEALGPDAVPEEPEVARTHNGRRRIVGAAFALAALSTVLPWSRFGEGASIFGAWHGAPRWSVAAALATLAGLVFWLWARRRGGTARADAAMAGLGGVVTVTALMAIVHPPYATHTSFAPWIAAAAGLAAAAAALAARRDHTRRTGQRV